MWVPVQHGAFPVKSSRIAVSWCAVWHLMLSDLVIMPQTNPRNHSES